MVDLVTSNSEQTNIATWLWGELHAYFDTNDGSLPELWLTLRTPADLVTVVTHLHNYGRLSPHTDWVWFDTDNHEQPLTDVGAVAALVSAGLVPPFHVLLTDLVVEMVRLPDLGMFVMSEWIVLDYRMGAEWQPETLAALFSLLAILAETVPSMTLTLENNVSSSWQDHFVTTWQVFRSYLTKPDVLVIQSTFRPADN